MPDRVAKWPDSVAKWRQSPKVTLSPNHPFLYYFLKFLKYLKIFKYFENNLIIIYTGAIQSRSRAYVNCKNNLAQLFFKA